MKLLIIITLQVLSINLYTQKQYNWIPIENENSIEVTKSDTFQIGKFKVQIIWEDSLYKTSNGYFGGIKLATFLLNEKEIQVIDNIRDNIGLGYVNISFYDYNLDGKLDFRVVRTCGKSCYHHYYLYDTTKSKFILENNWDELRIQKVDKKNKLLLIQPEGVNDSFRILKIVNHNKLIEITI